MRIAGFHPAYKVASLNGIAYSPNLSRIERVWILTRRLATDNRHFPSLADIANAVRERFDLWARPNRQLA